MPTEIQLATKLLKERKIPCNCGGPQYGTDHSPDCAVCLAWDDAIEDARQQLFERSQLA